MYPLLIALKMRIPKEKYFCRKLVENMMDSFLRPLEMWRRFWLSWLAPFAMRFFDGKISNFFSLGLLE